MALRRLLALVVFGLVASAAPAQEQLFQFSRDPNKLVEPSPDLSVRPNVRQTVYLFVKNPAGDAKTLTVTLKGPGGLEVTAKVPDVPPGEFARVRLPKPAPPPPVAPVPPVAPPPAAVPPVAPPPPLPPGVELKARGRNNQNRYEYEFTLSVTVGAEEKPRQVRDITVTVKQPSDYIEVPVRKFVRTATERSVTFGLKGNAQFAGPPCPVELRFPPQDGLRVEALRDGVYRRNVEGDAEVRLRANDLPLVPGAKQTGTVYLTVDGIARAFVFKPKFGAETGPAGADIDDLGTASAVRAVEVGKLQPSPRILTAPKEELSFRLEADNSPPGAKIELCLDKARNGQFEQPDEIVTRKSAREERVWLDPAGGEQEGMLVSTRVNDWVVPLDLRDLRGRLRMQARLSSPDGMGGWVEEATANYLLVIDDTAPDPIKINPLPPKHVRGTPLRVEVFAADPESDVSRVVVFLGKPSPEGKLPEGPKVDALPPKLPGGPWVAMLPLAADVKGEQTVGAQATNGVGLADLKVQPIQLIEPEPPVTTGTLSGVVKFSGKPQAGVLVILKNAKGEDQGAKKTDDKGAFKFEKLPPGVYKVVANKPDSFIGVTGDDQASVEVGKETKTEISLIRKP